MSLNSAARPSVLGRRANAPLQQPARLCGGDDNGVSGEGGGGRAGPPWLSANRAALLAEQTLLLQRHRLSLCVHGGPPPTTRGAAAVYGPAQHGIFEPCGCGVRITEEHGTTNGLSSSSS